MAEIIVDTYDTHTHVSASLDSFKVQVSVYYPYSAFGELMPAKVNWPCMGSQLPEHTKLFVQVLQKAIEIAEEQNKLNNLS